MTRFEAPTGRGISRSSSRHTVGCFPALRLKLIGHTILELSNIGRVAGFLARALHLGDESKTCDAHSSFGGKDPNELEALELSRTSPPRGDGKTVKTGAEPGGMEDNLSKVIKVLLVDDHGMVREFLRSYLEQQRHLRVVGEASHGTDALDKIKILQPDVVLLDLNTPATGGFGTLQRIHTESPKVRTIVVTAHRNPEYVFRSFRLGAAGYILKDGHSQELINAIETVFSGKQFINPSLAGEVISSKPKGIDSAKRRVGTLSDRERSVLTRIARGQTSKEIAQDFEVAVRTIQTYRERIMRKLNIHSVAGLTRYALTNLADDSVSA